MSAAELLRRARPLSILAIYEKLPEPERCGSDLRWMQVVELLAEAGHHVTLVGRNPPENPGFERARLEKRGIRVLGPDPERIHWAELEAEPLGLDELLREERFDLVLVSQFFWTGLSVFEQYLPLLRDRAGATPIVLLNDDCHWLREERRARAEGSRDALERSRALRAKERWTLEQADLVLCITDADLERTRAEVPGVRCELLSFCQTEFPARVPGFEARYGLAFLGTGGNEANVRGLEWFVREVLPRVPGLELSVIGQPPAAGWGCEGDPRVRVLGRLDELGPPLLAARVFVSPVAWGTGLKTKNVQALAHGLPLVLNTISAEGMRLEGEAAACVRDDAEGFADCVARLHGDRELWERHSAQALAHGRRWFSRERVAEDLSRALELVLDQGVRRQAVPERFGPGTSVAERFPGALRATKLSTRYQALLEHARELTQAGKVERALQEVRNVFCELVCSQVGPGVYAEPHVLLAGLYVRRGEIGEAAEAARAALERLPEGAQAARKAMEKLAGLCAPAPQPV